MYLCISIDSNLYLGSLSLLVLLRHYVEPIIRYLDNNFVHVRIAKFLCKFLDLFILFYIKSKIYDF